MHLSTWYISAPVKTNGFAICLALMLAHLRYRRKKRVLNLLSGMLKIAKNDLPSYRMRTWIMVRRIAHTANHRGEQTAILRMLGREIHSIYGPSADTGGLPQNGALTIYPYPDIKSLIEGESKGGLKAPLPGPGNKPCTERPDS